MTSFVVLVAVLCVTVNMAPRVAATTPANTDEDYNADYEDDDASQEDHHQNITHSLRHQNHSSFVTPTPEETDTDYHDFVANFGLENPDLVVGLPEGRLQNSSGVFSQFSTHETPFQTLTSTMNRVGSLDTSQVAEPLEEISSVAFSEKSEIEDGHESSTFFSFSSQLVSSSPGSVISVFLSSWFATPETVISENITSNAAVIIASTGARNLASTPTRTVASTPLGSVASTPAGTVTSTPFETVASTRVGTVASTSVGNVVSTRSRNVATTPVETVASTPSGNVAYSRAGIVASAPTGIIASTPVRTIASTPVGTVASTPAGIVDSTPAGIVASTPVETTASTPVGIVASTPVGTVASTPAGIVASTSAGIVSSTAVGTAASTHVGTVASTPVGNVASTPAGTVGSSRAGIVASTPVGSAASTHVETVASTPVGTVASTPAGIVASTPAGIVASTRVGTVASTPAGIVASIPAGIVASTPVGTVASTLAGIVTVTPAGIVSPTPVGIAASTPAADEPTSSLTLYNSFPSSMHEANIHSSMSLEADQAITSEHVELIAMEYAESTAAEHAESTAAIHAESIAAIHAESTAIRHAESTAIRHAEFTAAIHAESTAAIHVESTAAIRAESTAAIRAESTAAIRAESTAIRHAESTAIRHAESTAIRHAESTAAIRAESTAAEHAESTAAIRAESTVAIRAESTAAIHAESTAAIHAESTVAMQVESTFLKHRESTIAQAESVNTFIEIWNVSTRTSLQDSPHAAYETSIDVHAGMSSYVALISADIRSNLISAAQETSRFVRLSSTYSVTLLYSDSSQAGETAQRDAFMAISSYECCISSSFGSSLQDTVSATVYTSESSTFPGDLNILTSTSDMPAASFYHTYSQLDAKSSSVVVSALHTPLFLDGSVQPTSTMFSQSSLTQSLSSSRDIHISPKEHTAAATSLHEASEDSIGFSHSFQDTLHSHITSSFDSSLHLTQVTVLSSDTVLLTEHLRSSSRYDTPSVSDAFLSSVQDAPSRTETVVTSVYRTLDVSDFATSFGYDRIHTSGIIDTTIHDSRHPLEENNTSRYHVLHMINDTVASTYETLYINGSFTASSNVFSSHLLMHDSTTQGGYLDTSVESELQPSYYPASSILASSTARKTTLLFATSPSTPHHFAPETISVFSQWESGRRSVDVATLSSTFTSTIITEGASTLGQGSPVTSSATTYIGTRQTSWILTETSFGIPTSIQQIPTSIHKDLSTLTTSLSTIITTQTTTTTTTVENTTTPATTKHTTQHIETSTDLVPKATSNFTIAIYFYGDCEKASEKKYTGILNAKMLQFIRNISQIDDKSSILIGHIKCKPNHIPVSFFQADRTLVFLYLNDTFSTSPRYLRIHSLILNLTGYSEGFDASKRKGENEITTSDITIFATASCICLVLIIAGLAIFTKEIYHKKFSSRFSCPGSLGIHLKSETVALRSFPANKTDYKHAEMNEAAFVNEAYSSRCEDEQSSVVSEMKTAFPSSECSSPEETRDATRSKAPPEKNAGNATKSTVPTPVSLSNGTNRHEPPGYGLIIGLMGYTKRLERQQQRNEHQQQQQKLHFEESSYYAVPQKRSKPARNQDNTKTNVSPTPASYSPGSRPVTIEDSPVPPPRHLRTLHEVNELYESNEELVSSTGTTGADKPTNVISQTDTGLDNPSFLHERGRADVDSTDVFHF